MTEATSNLSVQDLVQKLLSEKTKVKDRKPLMEEIEKMARESQEDLDYLLDLGNQDNADTRLIALSIILPIMFEEEGESDKPAALHKQKGQAEKSARRSATGSSNGVYYAKLGKFITKALNASVEYCIYTLHFFDRAPWSIQREVVLFPVLTALKECEKSDLKRALAVWLGQKTEIIAEEDDFTLHRRIGDALTFVKDRENNQEVRDKVKEVLSKFWDQLNEAHFGKLKTKIEDPGVSDDDKTQAIRRLSHVNTLGSRESMEYLVEQLVKWVEEKKLGLVELTAEAIRYNRYAVLPLIDEFVKESRREAEQFGRLNTFARVVEQIQGTKKIDPEVEDAYSLNLRIRRRIARQLADMSDPRFFEEYKDLHEGNKDALRKHAVPALARRLPIEDDIEILEDMARVLGYSSEGTASGREAIGALARAVVGVDRTLNARRKLLDEYYLKPSKAQSENAAEILKKAISEARRNLRILQGLNILVFVVGLSVFFGGFVMSIVNQDLATRLTSALTSAGGLAGIVYHLVRRPLDRIQNAMANLVQMETAFTSFIWEQGLNSTYIQSQYVSQGKLSNDDIEETISRSQKTMALTMNLVSIHTETGVPRMVTRINKLEPVAGVPEGEVTIHGQNLFGDTAHYKKERDGLLAINHIPIHGKSISSWDDDSVKIKVPKQIREDQIWISLFIDGMETNALPFYILRDHPNEEEITAPHPLTENQS